MLTFNHQPFNLAVLGTAVLALALHLALGWAWTLGAGLVGGVIAPRHGGLVGLLGVGLEWAALVGYNYIVAGAAMAVMTSTLGGILGNTPGTMVVAATVFIGALLGGLGGTVGALMRRWVWSAA